MKLLTILASLLVGCASQADFNVDDSRQEKYNQASIDCERDTQQSGFYGGVIGKQDMEIFFKKCMTAKGWTPAQSTKP